MSPSNWLAVGLACVLAVLVAGVLMYLLYRRYVVLPQRTSLPFDEMVTTSTPVTCVVFSFGEDLSRIIEVEGVRVGKRVRQLLEQVVRDGMAIHGLREVENLSCEIVALSISAFAAVQCCLYVEEQTLALGLRTLKSDADGEEVGSPVRMRKKFPDSAATPMTAAEEGGVMRDKETHPHRLKTVRMRMGLSTGLVTAVKEEPKRFQEVTLLSYRGQCVVEAMRIATEVNPGYILVSVSTWYALSAAECRNIALVGCFSRRMTDCRTLNLLKYEVDWSELLIITFDIHTLLARDDAESLGTIHVANPYETLQAVLQRVPIAKRIELIISLSRAWGVAQAFREPFVSDAAYCQTMMDHLLDSLFADSKELAYSRRVDSPIGERDVEDDDVGTEMSELDEREKEAFGGGHAAAPAATTAGSAGKQPQQGEEVDSNVPFSPLLLPQDTLEFLH